ncbi:MAG TPA: HAMP domain-containing sensor histidine kinase [Anaerolineae bacterium]
MSIDIEELFPSHGLAWLARLHLGSLIIAAAMTLVGASRIPSLPVAPLLIIAALGAAIELALLAYLGRGRAAARSGRQRSGLIYAQLVVDIAGFTLFLHFAGGSENPFFPFYVFPVILAAALLSRSAALGCAGLAGLLYGGLLFAEGTGLLPHYNLSGLHDGIMFHSATYLAGLWLALIATCGLAAEATAVLMDALRRRASQLAESNRDAEARAGELNDLNQQLRAANEEFRHNREHLDDLYLELQHAYNRLEIRSRNMSELNEQLRAANAECKARREELATVYAEIQEAYRRLETRSEHMRELNDQLRAANSECSRQRNELAKLNKRLADANTKLSELDDARARFTLLVTHELRAPVAAIQSYLKLILDGYVKPDKVQETLEKAERRAMEQLALIADLLELGRIQSADARGKVEPVHLERALIEQMDLMTVRAQERGITIGLEVEPDLPAVLANNDQIRSMWNNLISNAIKYNRDGGRVTVQLSRDDDRVVGSVADTGIGIPPEAMGRLFSEFFRADNAKLATRMGTGLGLAIVKETIERAGGQISAESTLDVGTTFHFWLPVLGEKTVETAVLPAAA